jgi:hypothetical protein
LFGFCEKRILVRINSLTILLSTFYLGHTRRKA